MYTGAKPVQTGAAWTQHAVSTYPLRFSTTPVGGIAGLAQDPNTVYSSAKSWDTTPVGGSISGYANSFEGYRWNKTTYPDSANTISAMMTRFKTYNNGVNVNGNGVPLETVPEILKAAGKSVGVASTVQWADATPSVSGGAHNIARGNRNAIASEMLNAGTLDVMMGTGNPDYTNDGVRRAAPDHSWVSKSDWDTLKAGTHPGGFDLIQDRAEFQALATAATTPDKVVGTARSFDSTQANRAGQSPATEAPFSVARRTDVPTLTEMAMGALNVLDNNANGFFFMAEAGAVDRAMHANNLGRMIEEQIEFDATVAAISAYLDANTNGNNWENTLFVVTADHDHLLFGPDSDTNPFSDLVDNGVGRLPGHKWQFNSHSNQLVPLFVRGAGSAQFAAVADQFDAHTDAQGRTFGRGLYLDQTEMFNIFTNVSVATPLPPTAVLVLGTGLVGGAFTRLRRRVVGA